MQVMRNKYSYRMHACTPRCILLQVSWRKYKSALWRVIPNLTIVSLGFGIAIHPVRVWRGNLCGYDGLPSLSTFAISAAVFLFFGEVGFYYTHRYYTMSVNPTS